MKRTFVLVAALLPLIFWGCDVKTSEPTTPPGPTQPTQPAPRPAKVEVPNPNAPKPFEDHWNKAQPSASKKVVVGPSFGRFSRRMSVDQLRRTIPRLFNGLSWTYVSRGRTYNYFDTLSRTLGEADYNQINESSRESTSLFMKFMDDMAGNVCNKAVDADLKQTDTSKLSVVRYKEDIDKTLRFLRLKFHAIHVSATSTEGIVHLRKLFDEIVKTSKSKDKAGKEAEAWKGVCIALLTSPEFFAY